MKEDETQETKKDEEIQLGNTGEIELPTIDVSKYIGQETTIEKVTEHEGVFGYYIKVVTEALETLDNGTELRASRVFGLQEDKDGKIGWGKDTNLGRFLAKYNVKHYKGLVGMPIKVQTQTSKKNGKDYLSFN